MLLRCSTKQGLFFPSLSIAFAFSTLSLIVCLCDAYHDNYCLILTEFQTKFFLLSRRLVHDDSRGVAEALNETVCISKKCTGLTVRAN